MSHPVNDIYNDNLKEAREEFIDFVGEEPEKLLGDSWEETIYEII